MNEDFLEKGFSIYKSTMMMQNPSVVENTEKLLLKVKDIDTIIELGTNQGGFTTVLGEINKKVKANKIFTYDNYDIPFYLQERFSELGIEYEKGDLITVTVLIDKIKDIIRTSGKCVVFCDNGNKIEEFKQLSSALKKGDHILCHDYALSKAHAKKAMKDKIWNWCEITKEDIQESIDEYKLEEYMQTTMIKSAWGSFVKR